MKGFHTYSIQETEELFSTDKENGLTEKEALRRLAKMGKNELSEKESTGIVKKFAGQLNDFLIIILLAAAVISFVVGVMEGGHDLTEPVIILAIVIVNAVIGVVQENRAEKSLEMLKKMSSPHANVIRDGKAIEINASDVVCGDVLILKTGDVVPADARLISVCDISVDESAITGESLPVNKSADILTEKELEISERRNMVFASTAIVSGHGRAIVTGTGMDTEVGKVAGMIVNAETPETPMQKRMSEFGKKIGIIALIICALVFIVGILKGYSPVEMFITAVSLAVAAIPEGLPAIVTIMLALGVLKLARQGALIRHLPSVETLGSAGVICTDKTGTVTENKMKVTKVFTDDEDYLCLLGTLCCAEDTHNPTEVAIINYANDKNIDIKKYKKIKEIPFQSVLKKMTVLYKFSHGNKIISKGAADVLLPQCTKYWDGGKEIDLLLKKRRTIEKEMEDMAQSSLRVIAVAYKNTNSDEIDEKSMVFLGLFGIEDPPRPEAANAVRVCTEAGIVPVMITGDHLKTASAIAKKIGIFEEGKKAITGRELDTISDEELTTDIEKYCVFARVTPEHKARIVKAWQNKGEVVAMTGDGVNDAPALKIADIGCSLGKTGTEVAKAASDMVLTDDNFATIVEAVRHGRLIYENIKKTVKFLLSSNIGEIITIFFGMIMGFPPPLLAIQLLWVNLVTDSLPAIALGVDPENEELMKKKPSNTSLFSLGMMVEVIFEGTLIGILALIAFCIGKTLHGDIVLARTMAFCTLSISQLIHSFNMRSEKSIFKSDFFANRMLLISAVVGILMQVGVVEIGIFAKLFKVCGLSLNEWGVVGLLSVVPVVFVEIQKYIKNKKNNKKIKKS